MKKDFDTSYLKHFELPYECYDPDAKLHGVIHEDNIIDNSRWSITHRVVFSFPGQDDGTAWEAFYSSAATEYQDEAPWEYDNKVKCTLVRKMPVTVEEWCEVDEDSSNG